MKNPHNEPSYKKKKCLQFEQLLLSNLLTYIYQGTAWTMFDKRDSPTPSPDRVWRDPDSLDVPDTTPGVSCSPGYPGGL